MNLLIYTFIIGVISVGIQNNSYQSMGISFFIGMMLVGIIYSIMKKPRLQQTDKVISNTEKRSIIIKTEDDKKELNTEWKVFKQIIKGFGCMIFSVFSF